MFDTDALQTKLITLKNFDVTALTSGAKCQLTPDFVFRAAILAGQSSRDAVKMQGRALAEGVFGDQVPVELDGIIYDGGERPHHKVEIGYPRGPGLGPVLLGEGEKVLGNGEFVHRYSR